MKIKYGALIALIIALMELSLLPVLLNIGGRQIGTVTQLFYAFMIGSIVSISASYAKDRMQGLIGILKSQRLLVVVIVAGLLNDVISQLLLGIGSVGTNPVIAATIFRSWVIMAALLVPLALRQKVRKTQILAVAIGFLGIYILASGGTLLEVNIETLPFILILLGSALSTVYPNLAMKKYNVDVVGAVAIFNISSFLFMLALVHLTNSSVVIPLTEHVLLPIIFLGTATYGIGTALYYYALKAFGPLYVGNSILLVPFITIFLSFAILGTPVYYYYIVSAILLSAGVVLQRRLAKAPEHIPSTKLKGRAVFDVTSAFLKTKNPVVMRYLHGSNKALALKVVGKFRLSESQREIFSIHNCMVFSTKEDNLLDSDELDFVNEIMDSAPKDTIIIGIGNSYSLDESFLKLIKGGKGLYDFT